MIDETMTEAQQIAALALAGQPAQFDENKGGSWALVPPGYSVRDLQDLQRHPNRVRGDMTFTTPAALASYLDRFTEEGGAWGHDALLTVNYQKATIRAALDYSDADQARHHDHHAAYQAQIGRKFQKWRDMCGKAHTQVALAMFLESRAVDVVKPDAADVMEMVLRFEATKTVEFKQSTRLQDGARQFTYVEDTQQRGQITLPDHLIILAPVYEGLAPQPIKLWLRYRIEDAKLRLVMEVHAEDEVMRHAFERCVDAFVIRAPSGVKPVLLTVG